jgi:hypothetical protein
MHLRYLAYGDRGPLSPWIWAFLLGMLCLAIGAELWTSRAELWTSTRTTPIKGPALTGTAQIIGMAQDLVSGGEWCCINLRVHVPGREPYDVSITQRVPTEQFCHFRGGGGTVAVQVDATNPENVWIDFAEPITENRIADLERQLAEQKRRAGLVPASPEHAQPHPGSSRGLAQGRFVARAWRLTVWYPIFSSVATAAVLALIYAADEKLVPIAVVILAAGGLMALWVYLILRTLRKILICVTSDGLTVDQRPGEVFAFSDAKLGQWVPAGPMSGSGTALHLRCGSHRFVLAGRDHRVAGGTQLDAPPVGSVDAIMSASDFDELLTMVGHQSGLDVRRPAPEEPIRCLLVPSPSGGAFILSLTQYLTRTTRNPTLAIDVGKDAIWVIDPNNNAPKASASLGQVTATPADWNWAIKGTYTTPVLVVCVPGLQPLTIGCPRPATAWHSRFSWRGKVPSEKKPAFVVSETDWLTLAEKFGLASYLEDKQKWATG